MTNDADSRRIANRIDGILHTIDLQLRLGQFKYINWHLVDYQVGGRSIDELLAILTATLPAKSKLPSRAVLFAKIQDELRMVVAAEPDLLKGLE